MDDREGSLVIRSRRRSRQPISVFIPFMAIPGFPGVFLLAYMQLHSLTGR